MTSTPTRPAAGRTRVARLWPLALVVAGCTIAFAVGRIGGADVAGAARAGARQGSAAGITAGRHAGYRDGFRSGRAAGYAAEYTRGYAQRPVARRAPSGSAPMPAPPAATPAPSGQAAGAPAAGSASTATPHEAEIRDCTNAQRALHALSPLADDPALDAMAHSYASTMLRYSFFDHTDPWGRGIEQRFALFAPGRSWTLLGENIAAAESDPAGACKDWMHSAEHRANILGPGYTKIGTGFAAGPSGYHTYYVEDFAAP